MDRTVRRRMEMSVHARDFNRTHPSSDPNHGLVLDELEETIKQMEVLAAQQVTGVVSRGSSAVRRKEIRRRLNDGLLRHLVTVANAAADERPELTREFRMPSTNLSHTVYRTVARTLLDKGVAQRELLLKHGLGETLLDDLRQAVDELDASVEETVASKQRHILARSELRTLSDQVMQLVGILDGINRYRFAREPQLLAAWDRAKHVVGGSQVEGPQTTPEVPPGPTGPGTGEVKPAA
jgi:hypothetical protein